MLKIIIMPVVKKLAIAAQPESLDAALGELVAGGEGGAQGPSARIRLG